MMASEHGNREAWQWRRGNGDVETCMRETLVEMEMWKKVEMETYGNKSMEMETCTNGVGNGITEMQRWSGNAAKGNT